MKKIIIDAITNSHAKSKKYLIVIPAFATVYSKIIPATTNKLITKTSISLLTLLSFSSSLHCLINLFIANNIKQIGLRKNNPAEISSTYKCAYTGKLYWCDVTNGKSILNSGKLNNAVTTPWNNEKIFNFVSLALYKVSWYFSPKSNGFPKRA